MAVKQNDIRIGSRDNPWISLDNAEIISINGNLACDLLCEEIPIDTLEIQCRYDRMHRAFAPSDYNGLQSADGLTFFARDDVSGNMLEIPYATGLWYFNDGRYVGKFYVSDAVRTGKTVYTITAQSAMGVLDGLKYYGKMFLNQPLAEVLQDILLTDGLRPTETPFLTALHESIVLSDGLDAVKVSGWIPVCTKREAMHHVLFAQGLNIFKAENDAFLISRISTAVAGNIEDVNTYDSGSVDLTERVKLVEVAEHAFVPNLNVEDAVLYDNTEGAVDTEAVVSFDAAPIIVSTITATGSIQIQQKNENCALISGIGTLVGKPYAHTSHTISRANNNVVDGETVTVSDATLVNSLNSNVVADRVFAYYTQRKQMQAPIILSGERCGMKYGCFSPYGDRMEAYIAAMTITASAIAKADCRFVAGYVPPKGSGEFTHMVLLTGSGTFQVPEEVLNADNPRMRFVLIGGGDGGYGGEPGENGPDGIVQYATSLAKPGKPGKNGAPGKILSVQFEGANVLTAYKYSCGAGGAAGWDDAWSPPGTGGATYLSKQSSYTTIASSAAGAVSESGYLDILSGNIYGGLAPDFSHLSSGMGGGVCEAYNDTDFILLEGWFGLAIDPECGEYVVNETINQIDGTKTGNIRSADGGSGGGSSGIPDYYPDHMEMYPLYYDGFGGGGPVTSATENPEYCNGSKTVVYESEKEISVGHGGMGAPGTDAPSPLSLNPNAYGQGGIGGLGGGGGGGAGVLNENYDWSYYTISGGMGGSGGSGGKGSAGAPGCILVYY